MSQGYNSDELSLIRSRFGDDITFVTFKQRIRIVTGFFDFDFYKYDEDFNVYFGCTKLGLNVKKEYKYKDFNTFKDAVEDFFEYVDSEVSYSIKTQTDDLNGILKSFNNHVKLK